jgi:hypothetical protein
MTWQPLADWCPLTTGTGQSNGGVWLTPDRHVVKRLVPGVEDPRHHAYWQRKALVAESGIVAATPGLRSPVSLGVERDAAGVTLRMAYIAPVEWSPHALAAALGRFARSGLHESLRGVLRTSYATAWRPSNVVVAGRL